LTRLYLLLGLLQGVESHLNINFMMIWVEIGSNSLIEKLDDLHHLVSCWVR